MVKFFFSPGVILRPNVRRSVRTFVRLKSNGAFNNGWSHPPPRPGFRDFEHSEIFRIIFGNIEFSESFGNVIRKKSVRSPLKHLWFTFSNDLCDNMLNGWGLCNDLISFFKLEMCLCYCNKAEWWTAIKCWNILLTTTRDANTSGIGRP